MSSTPAVTSKEDIFWELKEDLGTVACHAAIQLDNLILKSSDELGALKRLAELIKKAMDIPNSLKLNGNNGPRQSLLDPLDPTTVVVMNRAMNDPKSSIKKIPKTIQELLEEANKVTTQLLDVYDKPDIFKNDKTEELANLRSFCLALSRQASAFKQSLYKPEL